MGILLRWDITNKCKLNCIHCYNARMRASRGDAISIEDIKKIINNLPADMISVVKLMGGEPFDSEHIYTICEQLDTRNIPFGVTTNGNFELDNHINIFAMENFRYVTFSLDGKEEEDIRLFRKNLNVHKVFRNIKEIRKLFPNVNLCLNLIINNQNFLKMYQILDFYFNMGIDKVNISALEGINEAIKQYQCSSKELYMATKQIEEYASRHIGRKIECSYTCASMYDFFEGKKLNISFDYRCRAGREIGYIDVNGNLFPCEAIQKNEYLYSQLVASGRYSLINNDFFSIWMQDAFNDVYNFDVMFRFSDDVVDRKCVDCKYRHNQCGKCFYTTN